MRMIKRKKHFITLATILGISGVNAAVGYGAAYTTPQTVIGVMNLESTDTASISSGSLAHGFTISGAGNVLNVNGATITGGTNIANTLRISTGGKVNIASGSEVSTSSTNAAAIYMNGAGSELTISGSKINGVYMGLWAADRTKVTINSSLSDPTIITTTNGNLYANQISSNSILDATGLIINDTNSQPGGNALLISQSQAIMDQSEINATGNGLMASNNSIVSFTNGKIRSTGSQSGRGIWAYEGSTVTVGNTEITVLGQSSVGVTARNSNIDITDSIIKMKGTSSYGFSADGTGTSTLNLKGTTVEALESSSGGMHLSSADARITLDDSKVTSTSQAIFQYSGSSVVDLKNGSELSGTYGLASVRDNSSLQINAGDNSRLAGGFYVWSSTATGGLLLDHSTWTGYGSAVTKVELQNNSQWEMTEDSTIKNLNFNGAGAGMVSYGTDLSSGFYGTLTVENLSGDGAFTMRTDLVGDGAGNNAGDFLEVTGTSAGEHGVTVQNNGAANATGDERLTIIRTADGVAKFSNTNVVELGGYEYNLREVAGSNKKEWELFGTKTVTPVPSGGGGGGSSQPGSAAVNLFGGSYLLNYAETQTLMKRMGDLRDGKENGNVWGRVYGGKFHSDTDHFLKDFDMNYSGVQVGADKKFVREDGKGVVYLGGFFGYSKGDIDYGYGSGNVDSKSLGAYWTHMHHNGFYADAVFKYGWMKNDFDVRDSQGARVTGDDISTRGFTGSLEVGRRYHFDQKEKSGWYVEPQAQVLVSHQNGDSFTASNGLHVKVDAYRSVLGRVGAHVGYEVKGGKNPINVYGKVSVAKEFDGDVDYSFNGSPETTSYKDTWLVYGVGATVKMGTRHNLYLDVERATGGQFTQSWAVNGGYRYAW